MSVVNWNSLNEGDTISIEVLKPMEINGQNTGYHTGHSFKVSLYTGDNLTGEVERIGENLVISTGLKVDSEDLYYFPIKEEENLKIVLIKNYVPPPAKPPLTDEQIAAEEQRQADNKERAERFDAEQKLKREQQQQQQQEKEKVRQAEIKKLGPWNVILNDGNPRLLDLEDTISIEVLKPMEINGQNTGRWTGGSFSVSLDTGDKLTGEVRKIGENLVISTGLKGDGEDLYYFPIQEKENLKIVLQEEVSPDVQREVAQMMAPIVVQDILSRAGVSSSKGGNKKSRKIYKKKTKNRTKTKKKKSRTSIKKHKLKKTSRRSRRSRKSKN